MPAAPADRPPHDPSRDARAGVVLMVASAAWFALMGRVPKHRRIARWTLPLWLYVSVSGVGVYWMLYRL